MIQAEAKALIATLSLAFPGARFSAENADIYERAIVKLDAGEVQNAVEALIRTAVRMPSVAELFNEVTSGRRERTRLADASAFGHSARAHVTCQGPTAAEWGAVLGQLLEASARYRRMAEPWFRARGKAFPGDPAAELIELASQGAKGIDVIRMSDLLGASPRPAHQGGTR